MAMLKEEGELEELENFQKMYQYDGV